MASNCYGYALRLDLSICPGTRNDKDSKVFNWSEGLEEYPFIDNQKVVLLTACLDDGLRLIDSAGKKIAVFIHKYEDCIDYHFYRLDKDRDNTWSCQDSTGGPITTGIKDPVAYDKNLIGKDLETGVLVDQKFAGMLFLPSGDDMTSGWD